MVKCKIETPTTRLKTLLLKLSKYTRDLKYQKGSEIHTSDALSILHNLTDTCAYSQWVENLYAHKKKDCDTTQVKRKHGRPPKQKIEQNEIQKPAANTHTT